jgi:hypothetical protein
VHFVRLQGQQRWWGKFRRLRVPALSILGRLGRLSNAGTADPGGFMRFLCLVMVDEEKLAALSKKEAQELDDISLDHDQKLRQSGKFLAAAALEPVRASKTVCVKDGKVLVTDGPFVETKEQVGGFILIDAKDLNEAIEIASKIPAGRELGSIVVRPVKELNHSGKPRP